MRKKSEEKEKTHLKANNVEMAKADEQNHKAISLGKSVIMEVEVEVEVEEGEGFRSSQSSLRKNDIVSGGRREEKIDLNFLDCNKNVFRTFDNCDFSFSCLR